jgi:hypothetical protein
MPHVTDAGMESDTSEQKSANLAVVFSQLRHCLHCADNSLDFPLGLARLEVYTRLCLFSL